MRIADLYVGCRMCKPAGAVLVAREPSCPTDDRGLER